MEGFKAFYRDSSGDLFTSRSVLHRYAVGDVMTCKEEEAVRLCKNGIHFGMSVKDCMRYFPVSKCGRVRVFTKVEVLASEIAGDHEKRCARSLKIVALLNGLHVEWGTSFTFDKGVLVSIVSKDERGKEVERRTYSAKTGERKGWWMHTSPAGFVARRHFVANALRRVIVQHPLHGRVHDESYCGGRKLHKTDGAAVVRLDLDTQELTEEFWEKGTFLRSVKTVSGSKTGALRRSPRLALGKRSRESPTPHHRLTYPAKMK